MFLRRYVNQDVQDRESSIRKEKETYTFRSIHVTPDTAAGLTVVEARILRTSRCSLSIE